MGVLYVVGTPLGNLEDLTPRAARILATVALIAAEDTRRTLQLLRHLELRVPLTSYHAHNWRSKETQILAALEHGDVALVTDGGMPGISDPGAEMVTAASRAGHTVTVVPGPTAVGSALAVSGFPADRFLFLGFLDRQGSERRSAFERIAREPNTIVVYEAPHRLRRTLADLVSAIGDRPLCVCRELTKLHEEIYRGTAAEALQHFTDPRGEFTLVIGPRSRASVDQPASVESDVAALDVDASIAVLRARGVGAREASAQIAAQSGLSRREVYRRILSQEAT